VKKFLIEFKEQKMPLISICIPAYKHVHFLERLLDSISVQTFKDYEVIITDDSPDDDVAQLATRFSSTLKILYLKNKEALGTPENWNEGIRKANGTWVKLMHDDDWFADENSLQFFYHATLLHPDCTFFFSAYNNIEENSGTVETVYLKPFGHFLLSQNPLNLFRKQYIGNPSCTLIKKHSNIMYDKDFKWVVDFEFYIRYLKVEEKFFYINKPLINVGINDQQVTKYTFRKPEVEIPENHLILEKMGISALRNIFVYDYYWRMYRNLQIRNIDEVYRFYQKPLHPLLKQMIHFQGKIPVSVLKKGLFSKMFMSANYMISAFKKIKK
jgi:glycosyltransferase involved in cell wall biosynthesis